MDWQAPKKTTPQKLARVQRATSNPIPECASPSLYIDLRTKTASSVARGSRGNWPWEAEVAFIPVNGAGGGVCAESRPPCVYPASYPSLAGGHLAMNGRKEGEGRREQGWATPMWPDTGYHLTSSARCPAGPTQSKLAPGTRGDMPPPASPLRCQGPRGHTCVQEGPLLPHAVRGGPSVTEWRATFLGFLRVPLFQGGCCRWVCLASRLPLLSLPPSRGQPGQRAGGARGHLGEKIEGHRFQSPARTWGLNHAHLDLQGDGGTG